jgi:simple sugar transport system substrate-binding protein
VTIMQLFMYQVSGGLLRPVDTDTGLLFVTQSSVGPYLSSKNRYEGASGTEKVVKAPSSIKV